MKYIALLRGINAGGNRKVDMGKLKALFKSFCCTNISTYINSGNVFFESSENQKILRKKVETILKKKFGFDIPTLIKTDREIKKIAAAIPPTWKNDKEERTDVSYLFPKADSKNILDELLVKKEFIDVRYIKGAIYWNVKRENVYKSHLGKLISHKLYQSMTIRNVNTARYLAGLKQI